MAIVTFTSISTESRMYFQKLHICWHNISLVEIKYYIWVHHNVVIVESMRYMCDGIKEKQSSTSLVMVKFKPDARKTGWKIKVVKDEEKVWMILQVNSCSSESSCYVTI